MKILVELTPLQLQVIACIMLIDGNKIIAHKLNVSTDRIKSTLTGLYRILPVKSKVALALWAVENGFKVNAHHNRVTFNGKVIYDVQQVVA